MKIQTTSTKSKYLKGMVIAPSFKSEASALAYGHIKVFEGMNSPTAFTAMFWVHL